MEFTKKDLQELRDYKFNPDCDEVRFKQIIKEKLLSNNKIIYVLNNKELEKKDCEADDYYGINILPYYMITPTQTNVENYLCYDVGFDESPRYNDKIKYGEIIFTILCDQKNIIDKETSIPRHDLLAALVLDEFNWKNYFGNQTKCISDRASVVDADYACRTLIFQVEVPNNLVKTKNGKTSIVTSEVHK